jgi:hypothetical protein
MRGHFLALMGAAFDRANTPATMVCSLPMLSCTRSGAIHIDRRKPSSKAQKAEIHA